MVRFGDYEIEIFVDGLPLREYDPPADEGGTELQDRRGCPIVCKYIEVVEGMEFEVRYSVSKYTTFQPRADAKAFHTEIGDLRIASSLILKHHLRQSTQDRLAQRIRGQTVHDGGVVQLWPFTFGALLTADSTLEETAPEQPTNSLGEIKFTVYDVLRREGTFRVEKHRAVRDFGPIPEKALKGQPIDLNVRFGAAKPCIPPMYALTEKVGHGIVKFVFRYRSRRALQLLGLIATTPDTVPLEERDVESLSLEQARELLRRQTTAQGTRPGPQRKNPQVVKSETVVKCQDDKETGPEASTSKRQRLKVDPDDDDECQILEVKKLKREEIEVVDLIDLV